MITRSPDGNWILNLYFKLLVWFRAKKKGSYKTKPKGDCQNSTFFQSFRVSGHKINAAPPLFRKAIIPYPVVHKIQKRERKRDVNQKICLLIRRLLLLYKMSILNQITIAWKNHNRLLLPETRMGPPLWPLDMAERVGTRRNSSFYNSISDNVPASSDQIIVTPLGTWYVCLKISIWSTKRYLLRA